MKGEAIRGGDLVGAVDLYKKREVRERADEWEERDRESWEMDRTFGNEPSPNLLMGRTFL